MKVILDMVTSLNGLIARDNGDEDWLPNEGWNDFVTEAAKHGNIVMGRETYEIVTEKYKDENFDDVPVDHKIIVTSKVDYSPPEGYVACHSPEQAVEYLQNKGLHELYLIGGGKLNAAFMKLGLVTDIELTVTPYILGKGRPFLAFDDYETGLTLQRVEQLSLGRVRLFYAVKK